jgi:hypothetical protein
MGREGCLGNGGRECKEVYEVLAVRLFVEEVQKAMDMQMSLFVRNSKYCNYCNYCNYCHL